MRRYFLHTMQEGADGVDLVGYIHQFITCFASHSSDRVTGCSPSCIGCCHSNGVVIVFLQSCYSVAGRAISDCGIAITLIGTLSWGISLPHHLIAVHHWATGNTPGEEDGSSCCWAHSDTWLTRDWDQRVLIITCLVQWQGWSNSLSVMLFG